MSLQEVKAKISDLFSSTTKLEKTDKQHARALLQEFLELLIVDEASSAYGTPEACPRCHSCRIVKKGKSKKDVQRYLCRDCKRTFEPQTNTLFNRSNVSYKTWLEFVPLFIDRLSCKNTSKRLHVCAGTAWLMRHRLMYLVGKHLPSFYDFSNQVVEMDEIYFNESYKGGFKKGTFPIPRPPKTHSEARAGLNKELICVLSVKDTQGQVYLSVQGRGKIDQERIEKGLSICKLDNAYVKTDGAKSYINALVGRNIKEHKVTVAKKHKGANLGKINSLHSDLRMFLTTFKGMSSKYLQRYLDYYIFVRKIGELDWDLSRSETANVMKSKRYDTSAFELANAPFIDLEYWDTEEALKPYKNK